MQKQLEKTFNKVNFYLEYVEKDLYNQFFIIAYQIYSMICIQLMWYLVDLHQGTMVSIKFLNLDGLTKKDLVFHLHKGM